MVHFASIVKTIWNSLAFTSIFAAYFFRLPGLCLSNNVSIYRKIDRDEFKKVMSLMRAQNRQGAQHRDGRRVGLNVVEPVENGGLLEYFFGKDGKTCLQHERFVKFLRDLHDEVCVSLSDRLVSYLSIFSSSIVSAWFTITYPVDSHFKY